MQGYAGNSKDRFVKLRNAVSLRGNSLSIEVPISRLEVMKYTFFAVYSVIVAQSASVNTYKIE